MIGRQKQNMEERKINRFQSFQNCKDNKFSACKYERNLLIGKSNNFQLYGHDDHDYITSKSPNKNIPTSRQTLLKSNSIETAENLCELWDQLGLNGTISESNYDQPYPQTQRTELTEQQLMQCFGEEEPRNKIVTIRSPEHSVQETHSSKKQTVDEDLLEIWEDDTHEQTVSHGQITVNRQEKTCIQEKQTIRVNRHEERHEQERYSWQEIEQAKSKHQPFQTLELHQEQGEDIFEMELQDPNTLSLHSAKIPTEVQVYNSSIANNQSTQSPLINPSEASILSHSQQAEYQQNRYTKKQQRDHSILKQILVKNYNESMTKLIPGKDYEIYNPKLFALSIFKPDTYSYFGIEIKNSSLLHPQEPLLQSSNPLTDPEAPQTAHQQPNIFYFYSFQTKEAFLQLKPSPFQKQFHQLLSIRKTITYGPGQSVVKTIMQYNTDACFKIRICSTKQHIATMFYKNIKDGYLFDLRLYDSYEHIHSEPIALIEVKDGFVNQCCYCVTNVFIQKKTIKKAISSKGELANSKKQQSSSYIEKLKMILNIKNGKLTANMGINCIESSPYNCCLENQQSKKFIYLMGLLSQQTSELLKENNQGQGQNVSQTSQTENLSVKKLALRKEAEKGKSKKKSNFIVKIGEGLSPFLGLAITAARKIYIDSFQ